MRLTHHPCFGLLRNSFLTKSLGLLGGLGLLSSGLAWSQTDVPVDNLGSAPPPPAAPAPAPVSKPAVAPPPPAPAPRPAAAPKPKPAPAPRPAVAPAPKPKPAPAPRPAVAPPPPAPAPAPRPAAAPAPKPKPAPAPQPAAAPTSQPAPTASPRQSAMPAPASQRQTLPQPTVSVPEPAASTPIAPKPAVTNQPPAVSPAIPESLRDRPPAAAPSPARQTQTYIDQKQYGTSQSTPSAAPSAPSQVIIRDRTQSCKSTYSQGRLSQSSCQTPQTTRQAPRTSGRSQPVAKPRTNVAPRPQTSNTARPRTGGVPRPKAVAQPRRSHPSGVLNQPPRSLSRTGVPNPSASGQQQSSGGVRRVVPQTFSLPTLVNKTLSRPAPFPNNSNRGLLFPLGMPSPISSVFGWRMHPIHGEMRMHTGTDLAAPQGTPVVAAYHGEVALAEAAGGYGNMVVIRHEDGAQESRYAHLAQIFVKAGEWVEQGEVIGLVGSTGASTGPHLHFEWRHWTANNWVPVDAGPQLEWALSEMRQAMLKTLPDDAIAEPELGEVALNNGTLLMDSPSPASQLAATAPSEPVLQPAPVIQVSRTEIPGVKPLTVEAATVKPQQSAPQSALEALVQSESETSVASKAETENQLKTTFEPQPLYRLEQTNPDQPLKVAPSGGVGGSAIVP